MDELNEYLMICKQITVIEFGLYDIIGSEEAEKYKEDMNKHKFKLKEQMVLKKHINRDGTAKKISYHEPTKNYPKGYYHTRISENYKPKRVTYEELVDCLFDFYEIVPNEKINTKTIEYIWNACIEEQKRTLLLSNNTYIKLRNDYYRFLDDDFVQKDITRIKLEDIQELSKNLVERGYRSSNGTYVPINDKHFNAYKCVLNRIWDYAIRKEIVSINLPSLIKNSDYKKKCVPLKNKADDNILSEVEIERIKKEIVTRRNGGRYNGYDVYGYMILLAIETGMRAGELCSLHWEDITAKGIHIHTQQLTVRENNATSHYEVPYTKNEKGRPNGGRYFPLTIKIKKILEDIAYIQKMQGIASRYIFCNMEGEWVHENNYSKNLNRLCTRLGYTVTNNHAFRKALNSNVLIPLGIPVTQRAAWLGHSVEVNLKFYSYIEKDSELKYASILDGCDRNAIANPCEPQKMIRL